jgi:hypothetical protein
VEARREREGRQTQDRARAPWTHAASARVGDLEEGEEEARAGAGSHAGKTRGAPRPGAGCVAPVRDRVATPVVAFGTSAAHPAFPARR